MQGGWLLRFSTTEPGAFAFTVLGNHNRVTHYRVTRGSNYEFIMRVNGADESFPSLFALLEGASKLLRLRFPIHGAQLDTRMTNNVELQIARSDFVSRYTLWTPPPAV